jgi:diadenosine tetraphosphate (Ap4A) HIT family hydrolase
MCAAVGGGDNDHTVSVAELPYTEVGLERRSRLAGYCVVVWKHGHVAEPTELGPEEAAGYWGDVLAVARAIEVQFRPMKLNLLTLGNWVPHLHTHVVPRYADDPAPGGPIAWEAMFSEQPVDSELLHATAGRLRTELLG